MVEISPVSIYAYIRHYRLINAIPGDIGQIFWYWTIYHKYISTKSNAIFLGISKKSCLAEDPFEFITNNWMVKEGVYYFYLKISFFLKRMLIVKHTGNKERNIVFQKWRGTHYRKWTWSVGFQRKKYCSKCANIHFHPGENPFRESSQLIKSCASCWYSLIKKVELSFVSKISFIKKISSACLHSGSAIHDKIMFFSKLKLNKQNVLFDCYSSLIIISVFAQISNFRWHCLF